MSADHIHELCERDHCGCDEDEDEHGHDHSHDYGHADEHEHHHGHSHSHEGAPVLSIIRSAITHTVQVSVFIFLVTLILVAVLETFGESAIEQFLRGNETLAVLGSALVGLIPNCSASVVITQLYLEGALQLAPMLAGTLISAGVGYLVLFRTNRSARENVLFSDHDVRHRCRLGPHPLPLAFK
ncbi:MAG: putative manganese transporter [Collinsella aerofaciens]